MHERHASVPAQRGGTGDGCGRGCPDAIGRRTVYRSTCPSRRPGAPTSGCASQLRGFLDALPVTLVAPPVGRQYSLTPDAATPCRWGAGTDGGRPGVPTTARAGRPPARSRRRGRSDVARGRSCLESTGAAHEAGDDALQMLSAALRSQLRRSDEAYPDRRRRVRRRPPRRQPCPTPSAWCTGCGLPGRPARPGDGRPD